MESALYPLPWLEWGVLRRGLGISGRGILPAHLCPCTKELFQQLFIDHHWSRVGGQGWQGEAEERWRDLCPTSPDLAWVTLGLVWAQQPQPLASLEAG